MFDNRFQLSAPRRSTGLTNARRKKSNVYHAFEQDPNGHECCQIRSERTWAGRSSLLTSSSSKMPRRRASMRPSSTSPLVTTMVMILVSFHTSEVAGKKSKKAGHPPASSPPSMAPFLVVVLDLSVASGPEVLAAPTSSSPLGVPSDTPSRVCLPCCLPATE